MSSPSPSDATPFAGPLASGIGEAGNGAGQCLLDDTKDAGFLQGVKDGTESLNCTSEDVDISNAIITKYSINDPSTLPNTLGAGQQIECVPGDIIYAETEMEIENNASERYDFGLWINLDGSAQTGSSGSCLHFNLVVGEPGVSNIDNTPDQCGDIESETEFVTISLDTLAFQCPSGGATQLTFNACAAWSNSTTGGNDRVCPVNPPGGATGFRYGTTPGTTAKCRCEDIVLPIVVKGVLRVVKQTLPDGDAQSFAFTGTGGDFAGNFNLTDGQTHVSDPLDPGTYGVTETVPAGWELTGRSCKLTGTSTDADFTTVGANGVSVDLGSGEDVTCTFTNTKQASITIKKVTVPAESPAVGSFSFTQNFDGTGNFSLGHNGTKVFSNVSPGSAYSVVESDPGPGYALTAISCTGAATYTGTVGTRTLSVTPAPGETILCTFTNTRATVNVSKTTTETFKRRYAWSINKVADPTTVTLDPGQVYNHPYSVTASVTGSTDSEWAVSGNITITNPLAFAVSVTGVSDVVAPAIAATVNCPVTFPYSLAGGADLVCTYSASLPDATTRLNTASVTLGGVAGTLTGTLNVDFTGVAPTTVEDACIVVKDEGDLGNTDPLGTVCVAGHETTGAETAPHTFNYTRLVPTGAAQCGLFSYDNTATGTTSTTATVITDSETIDVTIECPEGCTLTQGYWKTHNPSFADARNGNGPPPDDAWNILPDGEDSGFFTTHANSYPVAGPNTSASFTWFNVFWTSPKGNAYYNLAHQYMAAKLNVLDGVVPTADIAAAIAAAEDIFDSYTPAQIGALKGNNALRNQIIALAGTLGAFNEGLAGTEHCTEDSASALP